MTAIIFSFIISAILATVWVFGIENMNKNHPDYKGEDFLDWDGSKSKDPNDPFNSYSRNTKDVCETNSK